MHGMNIALLGATGGTGQEIMKQALDQGHTVRVLVRSPDKIETRHERLEVVPTDVMKDSVDELARKLGPSEVVVSSLGTGTNLGITRLYSDGTKRVTQAMEQANIKRIIAVSSSGTDPTPHEPWWYLWFVRRLLVNVYVDQARMEQDLMHSDLDWTIVRPSQLTNGEKRGAYRVAPRHNPEGGSKISRADVADFILKQLDKESTFVKPPRWPTEKVSGE